MIQIKECTNNALIFEGDLSNKYRDTHSYDMRDVLMRHVLTSPKKVC